MSFVNFMKAEHEGTSFLNKNIHVCTFMYYLKRNQKHEFVHIAERADLLAN